MAIQENLVRGYIDIVILHLLEERDMYGYELIQIIQDRSEGNFPIKEGSLYPVMYRMIERGFVTEQAVLVGKRRTRKYYHLTDIGKLHLAEIKEEYYKIASGMDKILNYHEEGSQCRLAAENENNI